MTASMHPLPASGRLAELLEQLERGLVERRRQVRLALLVALAGEHTLLIGPPGTAKSELARRLHLAFEDARYFERLRSVFGDATEVLTVVDATGEPVSSVLSFYFREEVLPYYAGDTVAARDLAANDFKYWDLMRRACERGLRVFDYGRSKRGTGSFDFKKNWGFQATPLAYEFRLLKGGDIPQQNPLNPKYRAMIALWRRLPRPLVNAIGPQVVRFLG